MLGWGEGLDMITDTLHLKAPGNWINDPNGFIYYHGKYHLFYQHFPYAPVWGTMHWGHAVSDDLIHWKHLDIALFPTKAYDRNGVFSGSAIEKDGRLYLYYSAVRYLDADEENIHLAVNERYETSQAMVVSEDGYHFDNWKNKRQILPVSTDEEIANPTHTRDPKVWKSGEYYYMVLGSTYREEMGRALFYKSRDAVNWEYVRQLRDGRFGKILECPDVFRAGDTYVFMGSMMYIGKAESGYEHHAVCMPADFNPNTCELDLAAGYQYVDYGLDLYAPQTNTDKDGRRVMIAWMRMPAAAEAPKRRPFNGMMCLPRVVEAIDGHIYFRIHPEVKRYFSRELSPCSLKDFDKVRGRLHYRVAEGKPCWLKVTMKEGEALDIGGYRVWVERDSVKTDRSQVFAGIKGHRMASSTPGLSGKYKLDIFVEPNLIEIFVNEGQYVISNVVYGLKDYIAGRIEKISLV